MLHYDKKGKGKKKKMKKKKTQCRPLRSLSSKLQHQRQKILPEASAESNTANITFTLLFGSWKMLFFGFVFFFFPGWENKK